MKRKTLVSRFLSLCLLMVLLLGWHIATQVDSFDASAHTEDELMLMEMDGDIIPDPENQGQYILNGEKTTTFPGPLRVGKKIIESKAFIIASLALAEPVAVAEPIMAVPLLDSTVFASLRSMFCV